MHIPPRWPFILPGGGRSRAAAKPISAMSWRKLKQRFKKNSKGYDIQQGSSTNILDQLSPAERETDVPPPPLPAQSPPLSPASPIAPLTRESIATLSVPDLSALENASEPQALERSFLHMPAHAYAHDVRSTHSSATVSSSQQHVALHQNLPPSRYLAQAAAPHHCWSSSSASESGFFFPGSRSRGRPRHPPATLTFSRRPRTGDSERFIDVSDASEVDRADKGRDMPGSKYGGCSRSSDRKDPGKPSEAGSRSAIFLTRAPRPPTPLTQRYTVTPCPYALTPQTATDEATSPPTDFIPASPRQKLRVVNLAPDECGVQETPAFVGGPLPPLPTPVQVRRRTPLFDAYNMTMLEADRATHTLMRRLSPAGSPTFYDYGTSPPATTLDLGCGQGDWLRDAAQAWRGYGTRLIGMDAIDLTRGKAVGEAVNFVRGDFLRAPLPFPDGVFDLVRLACLTLAIPSDALEGLLREVSRVLALGGRLEFVEDRVCFPFTALGDGGDDSATELERAYVDMLDADFGVTADAQRRLQGLMEDIFGHQRLMCVLHMAKGGAGNGAGQALLGDSKHRSDDDSGLVLLPSSVGATTGPFIPMTREEVEVTVTRHARGLLASRDRIIECAVQLAGADEAEDVRQVTAEALWKYEMHFLGHSKLDAAQEINAREGGRHGEPALPDSPVLPPPPFQAQAYVLASVLVCASN
ncbi:hypothetical protein HDZ31DRAFT_82123 [Schizophyllum fasciatum]